MLRELNENEMEMVSGGGTVSDCVGSADGTTVTCTYHEGNTEIITYGRIGGGSLPLTNGGIGSGSGSLPQNNTFGGSFGDGGGGGVELTGDEAEEFLRRLRDAEDRGDITTTTTTTTVSVEIPDDSGTVRLCLETIFGCITINEWP